MDYASDCYLCPGNVRVSGEKNAAYSSVYVFDNDHPAFSAEAPTPKHDPSGLYRSEKASGTTRVMCYSPHHEQSLAELSEDHFIDVFNVWAEQTEELLQREDVTQVLIFENKGEVIGVSNPHPHCQLYGASFEFKNLELERLAMEAHLRETGSHPMREILAAEQETDSRLVAGDDQTLSFLPYFSRFPFETYICPLEQHNYLFQCSREEMASFARVTRETLIRFDNLWQKPFPYMLVLHQAPKAYEGFYHTHIQVHPLVRQPSLQKYLAGVESGGGHFLNDVDPDGAAAQLRSLSGVHYRHQGG